ncbi:DUF202 domain-containing protein [Microbacterium sp. Mu-80]|uniref:DUF202 domain-containing protein n=1 Tax=Microbacterium bandirmense TaxID=3122050 RepID=A0ABU8L909_9MICO
MTQFDPGLQPERTQLAWRRTALSLAIGSLIAARALPVIFASGAWVVPGILGVAVAGALWAAGGRRARAVDRALSAVDAQGRMPDAVMLLVLVVVTVCIGVVGLVVAFAASGV